MSVADLKNRSTGAKSGKPNEPHNGDSGPAPSAAIQGPTRGRDFQSILIAYKNQIAMALPKHMNPDRMVRIALTEFNKTRGLRECTPDSIFASIIIASQVGLEPGVMGQGYLIPYKDTRNHITTCTFVPGWQGYVDLVNRAGRACVFTGAVRPGDFFEYEMGARPDVKHRPGDGADDVPFTFVYAVGWVRDAQHPVVEVWSRAKVESHLKRYNKVGENHYALTNENNKEMYGRKVALLQVIKYMPKSVELQLVSDLDAGANSGAAVSLADALAGTFTGGYQYEDGTTGATIEGAPQQTSAPKAEPAKTEPTPKKEEPPMSEAEAVAWAKAEKAFQDLDIPDLQRGGFREEYKGRPNELLMHLDTIADFAAEAQTTVQPPPSKQR